ncbi:SAV_2336 N-terminal domain-related protein [Streptomyces sp. NPDC004126]|uniref:SAV_2336 N-terminal domain-related protein n=1 Tax=Streptomyces sp. NPDC004126 TaxID=3390695 RepID=UPI003D07C0DB
MLEALIRALRRVGADVDPVAIADALWLARAMGDAAYGGGAADTAGVRAGPAPAPPPYADPAEPEETPGPDAPYPPGAGPGTYDTGGGPDGPGTLAAVTGRIRRGSALPDGPALARALRPLRRRRPGGRERGLDVDATVDLYARTEELTPVFTALPERWFRLDLVVDASPSMQVWRETADDLHVLLQRLGAFSTVRRWSLGPGPADAPVLLGPDGGAVPPARLRDAQGRALLLVLSDCVADGWHAPDTWRMLRDWTRSTATVLLNPLPRTLWPYTGLDGPVVSIAASGRGARSADLAAGVPDGLRRLLAAAYPDVTGPWLPCPVAGISAAAAETWAGTLMAVGDSACEGVLIPPGGRPPDPEDEDPYPEPYPMLPVAEPELLVDAFRRVSSPQARRLAVLCSPQNELSLPVLRAVQAAMEPASGVDVLAELVVSDLFEHVPGTESGELRLRFRPGVREELRTSLSAEDAWQVYFALSRFAEAEAAPGTGHPVAVAAEQGRARIPAGLLPFAAASRAVLRLLGAEPATVPPDEETARPVPQNGLLFRIGRSGAGPDPYTVEAWTLGDRRLIVAYHDQGIESLRRHVTSAMVAGWAEISSEAPSHMITVEVPQDLLDLPFDTWTGLGNQPYGVLHPVVFRCPPPDPDRRAWYERWNRLLAADGRVGPSEVHWAMGEAASSALKARLREDDRLLCVVLDGPPTGSGRYAAQFRVAQAAGIPAVLWNRDGGNLARFRDEVSRLLDMGGSLPERVMFLHRRAWQESETSVALVWNDPALERQWTAAPVSAAPEPVVASPSRSRTYAVVVGVETYTAGNDDFDLDGPAQGVRGITDWLLAQGVPPDNVTALVSPLERNREVTEGMGVPTREATAENVMNALFQETAARTDAELLLIFWSGHGFTGPDDLPCLLTTDDTVGRGISVSGLLRRFRLPEVSTCGRQLWFIDVGVTLRRPGTEEESPEPLVPHAPHGRPGPGSGQNLYMARVPEREQGELPREGGVLLRELPELFREVTPWDEALPSALGERLRERFAELGYLGRPRRPRLIVDVTGPETSGLG